MLNKLKNAIWVLLGGAAAFWALTSLVGVVWGGPLDPPGPPAPTMKTLDDIPPSWHQSLSATGGCTSARFDCVLAGDGAVLDKETGLVWDRTPDVGTASWSTAANVCFIHSKGAVRGWRLPSEEELSSLIDTPVGLPTGHPFIGVSTTSGVEYWTMTADPSDATKAYVVGFSTAGGVIQSEAKTNSNGFWCVRGGPGHDGGH